MPSFILRNLDPDFWTKVQAKAAREGTTVKELILRLLTAWLATTALLVSVGCAYHAPDAPTPIATTPSALTPASIQILSASRSDHAMDIVAVVHTADGRTVPDILVQFATSAGSMTPERARTGADGRARSVATSTEAATVLVTAGALSASTAIAATTTPTVALPTPPTVPPPTNTPLPTAPLTVAILATPRLAGSATDFSLATQAITQATWTFGDGSADVTTSTAFTSHVYAAAGSYAVSVTVRDASGRTASATQSVAIFTPTTTTPPSTTGLTVTIGCTPAAHGSVTACNLAATYNGTPVASGAIARVDWDWGDGVGQIVTNSPLGTHTYASAGTYLVSPQVTVNTVDGPKTVVLAAQSLKVI